MKTNKTVVVAMSGGVDSSVAAVLLKEQGYQVIGMMLRLWSEPGRAASNRCCTPAAMATARRVAAQLEIPFYTLDAKDIFRKVVVDNFISGYSQGITPNPCLACNQNIRWGYLLNQALNFGADFMATGHYVKLQRAPGEPVRLFAAKDEKKDQSYVLSVLNQDQLQYALFPLGNLTKPEVRAIAKEYKLPAADSKESQDLCFLAGDDYRNFLHRHAGNVFEPGQIINTAGEEIGQHAGLANYTIGQRKGLGISSPHPLYVIEKNVSQNTLLIGTKDDLGSQTLETAEINWLSGTAPHAPFEADIKIRYSSQPRKGTVTPREDNTAFVEFFEPVPGITPGQAAVFYYAGEVIGGGLIQGKDFDLSPVSIINKVAVLE